MASDTAVAEAPPQAELAPGKSGKPGTWLCFTVFGTWQEREIPKALIGLPRRGGAFAKWHLAQWKQIRKELAAIGNIAARESIKKEVDSKRGWQQLPVNKAHRNQLARRARRVRKLKAAVEKEEARLAKNKITLEKLKRDRLEKKAEELRRAKAEDVD